MAIPSISSSTYTPPMYHVTSPVRGRPLAAPALEPGPSLPTVGEGPLPINNSSSLPIANRNGEVTRRGRGRGMANSFGSFFGNLFSCGSSG